ncbi:AMP-binding protein [Roseovarius sp.]|uniref:phenylacetate--CoA ligase family protein n=1 Tax=Roseovarius sp. TaxID=1486281 RepID=UPI002615D76E|nr:AMP-binding protein [Roseovarius sp.]MDM8165679.1 AMP-binding protein [Roseovarius sp.]
MNLKMAEAPHASVWDEVEVRSRDRIEADQLCALSRQLDYLARHSLHYADVLGEAGFAPGDLGSFDDLRRLPMTGKADFVASVAEAPPMGRFVAAPREDLRRIHFSSGTTAAPMPQFWTQFDLDRWADLYARNARAQGVGPGDVFQCLFTYAWFVGGLGATMGYQRAGATCIPAGSQDTERQIRTMREFGTTALCGTPSFIIHLGEEMLRRGIDPAETRVDKIMVGGEPGAGVPATRKRIETLWNAGCFDAYGCLEFQPIAGECAHRQGGHIAEDFVYAEILDPETHMPVPDGTPGMLVVTHLDKQAGPLLRWKTNDIVVRDSTPCSCGRTHARLVGGVRGRADDMLIVRGINVFPSAIEDVVRSIGGLADEYQIVIDDTVRETETGMLKGIRLKVEAPGGTSADTVAAEIKRVLNIRAHVEIVPDGALPRATHKAQRLIRH